MKQFFKGLGIVMLAGVMSINTLAAQKITVTYDGEEIELEQGVKLSQNVILLPLRCVSQSLGYKVDWEPQTKKIELSDGSHVVILYVNSKEATVNDKKVTLDVTAKSFNGVTYVPLRFIGEAMEGGVNWNSKAKRVELEGKYTVDKATKNLMVRTKEGKKVLGKADTYSTDQGDRNSVLWEATKQGSELVTVWTMSEGALTSSGGTTFYIKDGKVIDKFVEEVSIIQTYSGLLRKNNEIAISDGKAFKIYDDTTGKLLKKYMVKEKLGAEGFTPISYSDKYLVGYHAAHVVVIDLVSNKVTRILDLLPDKTEDEKMDKYYVYPDDMALTAMDDIKMVWETDEALVFKYHSSSENKDKTITYMIGK